MGMCSTLVSMRVVDDPRVGQCFDTRGSVFFYNTFGTSPQHVAEKSVLTDCQQSFEEA